MKPYHDIEDFSTYYLEDSYVLWIVATPAKLVFDLDVVLTLDHPEYRHPKPGERYCYRRGWLSFGGVTSLSWEGQGAPPAQDASGEFDYGNIDSWLLDESRHELVGDFGSIAVVAEEVDLTLFEMPFS